MSLSWNFSQDIVTSFMGIQPVQPWDRDLHTEGPLLCLVFCSHHLEILNFYLWVCVLSVQWDNAAHTWAEEIHARRASISCRPIHIPYAQRPKSTEFQWTYHVGDFSKTKTSTRQVCSTCPKGIYALYFIYNLFWMQKRSSGVLRTRNEQETLPCFPTLTASLC